MAFSYSSIKIKKDTTLPSVASWGTNMNILKDPPKSIHTRRINKVGNDSAITTSIDGSGDRFNEAISYYAKGVNPMVGVSYSNMGNNGGQRGGSVHTTGGICSSEASLPYKIMQGGAFRPPIIPPQLLLPLSRQPRLPTKVTCNPGFKKFSSQFTCSNQTSAETCSAIQPTFLTEVRPTAVYTLQKSALEPIEVKYNIQPCIKIECESGTRTMDVVQRTVQAPYSGIVYDSEPINVTSTAKGEYSMNSEQNNMNVEKYIQNPVTASAEANKNSKVGKSVKFSDMVDAPLPVKNNTLSVEGNSGRIGSERIRYDATEDNMDLRRPLPVHSQTTNKIDMTRANTIRHNNTKILERNKPLISSNDPINIQRNPNPTSYNKKLKFTTNRGNEAWCR
jgi:hypothetical protein